MLTIMQSGDDWDWYELARNGVEVVACGGIPEGCAEEWEAIVAGMLAANPPAFKRVAAHRAERASGGGWALYSPRNSMPSNDYPFVPDGGVVAFAARVRAVIQESKRPAPVEQPNNPPREAGKEDVK